VDNARLKFLIVKEKGEKTMENNNEILTNEELTNIEATENCYEADYSDGGLTKFLVGALFVGAAALGGVIYKNKENIKNKREEKEVARLEKKGYVVMKADSVKAIIPVDEDEFEEETVEENATIE
jgi:hypothetical protein